MLPLTYSAAPFLPCHLAPYSMDLPPAWLQSCICSQIFSVPQAYTCHKHSCLKTKKLLSGALEKAKDVWKANKHRKTEEMVHHKAMSSSIQLVAVEPLLNLTSLPGIPQQVRFLVQPPWSLVEWFSVCQTTQSSSANYADLHQSLAEQRTCHEHIMPRRYQDIAPEPPAALPPPSSQVTSECTQMEPDLPPSQSPLKRCPTHASLVRRILKSPRNAFGLFQQYYATRFPDHDPGENITHNDFIDAPPNLSFTSPAHNYYPYPNQSSFLLGEWYWNDSERKSRSSFQNLLKIVGHLEFCPEDVVGKNWRLIDA